MSVSLQEVIESAGYDLSSVDDARWLLSKEAEFTLLLDDAEKVVEDYLAEQEDV